MKRAMAETHTANCYYGAVEIEVRGDPLVMVIAIAKTAPPPGFS
jgi:hypothetical protein